MEMVKFGDYDRVSSLACFDRSVHVFKILADEFNSVINLTDWKVSQVRLHFQDEQIIVGSSGEGLIKIDLTSDPEYCYQSSDTSDGEDGFLDLSNDITPRKNLTKPSPRKIWRIDELNSQVSNITCV